MGSSWRHSARLYAGDALVYVLVPAGGPYFHSHSEPMFHVFLDGETDFAVELRSWLPPPPPPQPSASRTGRSPGSDGLTEFDQGFLVGLLVGEGSFGGDGKQPQVTLRMHTRHEALFRWLMERFPRPSCTGPTTTAGARTTSGWRAAGRSCEDVLPLLEYASRPELDGHAAERFDEMRTRTPASSLVSGRGQRSRGADD